MGCRVVYWKPPNLGSFKCNSNGAAKGNPGPRSSLFCIRNKEGDLIYAESRRIADSSNLIAEAVALKLGLEYCVEHNLIPLILKTESLALNQMVIGMWEVPWCVAKEI